MVCGAVSAARSPRVLLIRKQQRIVLPRVTPIRVSQSVLLSTFRTKRGREGKDSAGAPTDRLGDSWLLTDNR